VIAAPHFRAAGQTFAERVAWVNQTGLGVIGTPDEAVARIERLERQSGGFGSSLLMHHEWARHDATLRSYEPFASHVKPRFQRATGRLEKSRDYRGVPLDRTRQASRRRDCRRHGKAGQGTGRTKLSRDPGLWPCA
jgi:limonene 1,2-monooxygenase